MSAIQNRERFDANQYWLNRGVEYIEETRLRTPFYQKQEAFIVDVVRQFQPKSILELGCGFGRITRRILEALPNVKIVGIDLSPDQVRNARSYCEAKRTIFYSDDLLMDPILPLADLCLAVELFLHLPFDGLQTLVPKILRSAPILIHDFDPEPTDRVSRHIYAHDYDELYNGMDVETILHDPYGLKVIRA